MTARVATASGRGVWLLHGAALVVVVVGLAVQVARPLAPDLGALPDPGRWFDTAYLVRAATYAVPRDLAAVVDLAARLALPLLVAVSPVGRWLVDRVLARVGVERPAFAATVVVLLVVVGIDLLLAPVAFGATYLHDRAWGLRTDTPLGWISEWLAVTVPVWVGVTVLVSGGYVLARRLPHAWPAVASLVGTGLTAFVALIAPLVLEPLLFRLEPLPEGPVRAEVESVLAVADEPVDAILVADASRRTRRQNAYVSGLWGSRRIVLYDTLVDNRTPAEVAAVLAHEVGHHQNRDLLRGVAFAGAGITVTSYLLAGVSRWRTRRGRQEAPADPRAAVVVLAVVVVVSSLSAPLQQFVSRRAEAAADLAALNLTRDPEAFIDMQIELTRAGLGRPLPPQWRMVVWGTHPPTVARLEMAERWPEVDGVAGGAQETRR